MGSSLLQWLSRFCQDVCADGLKSVECWKNIVRILAYEMSTENFDQNFALTPVSLSGESLMIFTVVLALGLALLIYLATAPSPVAHVAPAGIRLKTGGPQVFHTNALDTDISLWATETGFPGIDGGDPIDTTTQENVLYRTMAPRVLQTLTPFPVKYQYDPACYSQIIAILNRETTLTNRYNDGSTLAFYGYWQKAEFDAQTEGNPPTVTVTIVPTNFDPTNKVEAGPVLTSVAGT